MGADRDAGELEALDPVTGQALAPRIDDVPSGTAGVLHRTRRRSRRLHRLARLLAALAVACGLAAGYFGLTIANLRSIEGTWRRAMALDAVREETDEAILAALAAAGDADDDAGRRPIGRVGDETAERLGGYERDLAGARILDSKLSDLRDEMIKALTFRRLQLSPARLRLGSSPLQKVENGLAEQLERWDLEPITVGRPTLRTAEAAIASMSEFADAPTGVTLVAVGGRRLLTIDVDGDAIASRLLPTDTAQLLAFRDLAVVVSTSGGATAYRADDATSASAWSVAADRAVVDVTDGQLLVQRGATVVAIDDQGQEASPPVVLPAGRVLAAAVDGRLVLTGPGGSIETRAPGNGQLSTIAARDARFLGAGVSLIAYQRAARLADVARGTSNDDRVRFVDHAGFERSSQTLPRTDAITAAFAPRSDATALTLGPLAGRLASVLLANPPSPGLAALEGPRAKATPGAVAWSPVGDWLFWLTPEGRIAIHGQRPVSANLLRTGLEGLDVLVAFDAA